MASIFTKIIQGEIPCYKIAETEDFIAFLDIQPNAVGHTLCVPKVEVDKLFDLDNKTYTNLMQFSKRVAEALEATVPCKRVGMAVVGLEVPHVHVHLIPLNTMRDITFAHKVTLTPEAMAQWANKIQTAFK